jgi:hypothetical protein
MATNQMNVKTAERDPGLAVGIIFVEITFQECPSRPNQRDNPTRGRPAHIGISVIR